MDSEDSVDSGDDFGGCRSPEIPDQTPLTSRDANCRRQLLGPSVLNNSTNNRSDPQQLILEELRKTNASITAFSTRMDAVEKRLRSVENQQREVCSSSSSSPELAKRKIPSKVWVRATFMCKWPLCMFYPAKYSLVQRLFALL